MLPILLVLVAATSVLAAPTQVLNLNDINEVAPRKSNGRLVGSYLPDRAFEIRDGGENSANLANVMAILNDLADHNDRYTQAQACVTTIAILKQLSTGYPGDACEESNAINGIVRAGGNSRAARAAAAGYIRTLASSLGQIAQLATNPDSLSLATGPRGNCQGGGGSYAFEAAWDLVLSGPSPAGSLQNEQYCVAKRLFNGFDATSRNVGAAVTIGSLSPVVEIVLPAMEPVAGFLQSLGKGGPQVHQAANSARQALIGACGF